MAREIFKPETKGLKRPLFLSDLLPGILNEIRDAVEANPGILVTQLASDLDIALDNLKWITVRISRSDICCRWSKTDKAHKLYPRP